MSEDKTDCAHVFGENEDTHEARCVACGAPQTLGLSVSEEVKSKDRFGG